jgi:hypothetical protein
MRQITYVVKVGTVLYRAINIIDSTRNEQYKDEGCIGTG